MRFKFLNKNSVIGFLIGAVISASIITAGLYVYIQKQINDLNIPAGAIHLPPPEIPIETRVNLDWNLKTLSGTQINLEKEYEDKVIFINFWATWCPPCIAEMPAIEKLYQKFKDRIGFACISNESLDTIKDFKNKNKYSFSIYQGEMEVPAEFNLTIIPATFIISRGRKIALKHEGPADWSHQKVIEYLEALINQTPKVSKDLSLAGPQRLSQNVK
jgi:thiol-disulfide isomerase/thioredoxin